MPQQHLDVHELRAGLQEPDRIGMPELMGGDLLIDATASDWLELCHLSYVSDLALPYWPDSIGGYGGDREDFTRQGSELYLATRAPLMKQHHCADIAHLESLFG
jgi:hypothetical protein